MIIYNIVRDTPESVIDMKLTQQDIEKVAQKFKFVNGFWNKKAVSYLGLSFPLQKGWKESLLIHGVPSHAPIAQGVSIEDHLWTLGEDVNHFEKIVEEDAHKDARHKNEHLYVMSQIDALEIVINDLRSQADNLRTKVRELRNLISEDDF